MEPKIFGDLEPEPKINLSKHFLPLVWRMLGQEKLISTSGKLVPVPLTGGMFTWQFIIHRKVR